MKVHLLLFACLCTGCSIDRTIPMLNPAEEAQLAEFQSLAEKSKTTLAKVENGGKELILCLNYVCQEEQKIISHQEVLF